MKPRLLDNISTPQELKAAIIEVHRYARWYTQESLKAKLSNLKPSEPLSVSQAASAIIHQWSEDKPLSQQRLDELIEYLEDFEASAPNITITLAAPPPTVLKKKLVEWCRKNIDADILVNFQFNSTILGGMVVRYGSHVYDWSFRRQILASRAKFAEVLRRV